MNAARTRYAPPSAEEIRRLVIEYPLAWITSGDGEDLRASLMPVRPGEAAPAPLATLTGHFPRANPQVAQLERKPQAWILFVGPHAYASPSWLTDRTQAPTWNFASAQFRVEFEFLDEPSALEDQLHDLVDAMEADRPNRWRLEDMGQRYQLLARHIVAFRAHICEVRPRFKLGQSERDDVYRDMVTGLGEAGHGELVEWMQRCNPGRA